MVNVITLVHVALGPAVNSELSPTVVVAEAEILNELRITAARITFAVEPTQGIKPEKIVFEV